MIFLLSLLTHLLLASGQFTGPDAILNEPYEWNPIVKVALTAQANLTGATVLVDDAPGLTFADNAIRGIPTVAGIRRITVAPAGIDTVPIDLFIVVRSWATYRDMLRDRPAALDDGGYSTAVLETEITTGTNVTFSEVITAETRPLYVGDRRARTKADWTSTTTRLYVVYPTNRSTPAPVIIVSHGNSYYGDYYIPLCRRIAAHGIVCAAPSHPPWEVGSRSFGVKAALHGATVDFLHAANASSSSPLQGLVGADTIVAGHSWGGGVASQISLAQPHLARALIILDARMLTNNADVLPVDGQNVIRRSTTPFYPKPTLYLMMHGSANGFGAAVNEMLAAHPQSPALSFVAVGESVHESLLNVEDGTPYGGSALAVQTHRTAAHFIVAFVRAVVDDDPSAVAALEHPTAAAFATSEYHPEGVVGWSRRLSGAASRLLLDNGEETGVDGVSVAVVGANVSYMPPFFLPFYATWVQPVYESIEWQSRVVLGPTRADSPVVVRYTASGAGWPAAFYRQLEVTIFVVNGSTSLAHFPSFAEPGLPLASLTVTVTITDTTNVSSTYKASLSDAAGSIWELVPQRLVVDFDLGPVLISSVAFELGISAEAEQWGGVRVGMDNVALRYAPPAAEQVTTTPAAEPSPSTPSGASSATPSAVTEATDETLTSPSTSTDDSTSRSTQNVTYIAAAAAGATVLLVMLALVLATLRRRRHRRPRHQMSSSPADSARRRASRRASTSMQVVRP